MLKSQAHLSSNVYQILEHHFLHKAVVFANGELITEVNEVRIAKKYPLRSSCKVLSLGQSHKFWRAYSLFVALVASFAPGRSEYANDATRDTNKLYAGEK